MKYAYPLPIHRGTKSEGEDGRIVFTKDRRHQLRWKDPPTHFQLSPLLVSYMSMIKCHWVWSNVDEDAPRDLPGLPHEYCQELARFQSNKSNNSHMKDFTQFPRRPCFLLYLKPLWLKKRYNLQDMFLHLVCAGKNKHLIRTLFWVLI